MTFCYVRKSFRITLKSLRITKKKSPDHSEKVSWSLRKSLWITQKKTSNHLRKKSQDHSKKVIRSFQKSLQITPKKKSPDHSLKIDLQGCLIHYALIDRVPGRARRSVSRLSTVCCPVSRVMEYWIVAGSSRTSRQASGCEAARFRGGIRRAWLPAGSLPDALRDLSSLIYLLSLGTATRHFSTRTIALYSYPVSLFLSVFLLTSLLHLDRPSGGFAEATPTLVPA